MECKQGFCWSELAYKSPGQVTGPVRARVAKSIQRSDARSQTRYLKLSVLNLSGAFAVCERSRSCVFGGEIWSLGRPSRSLLSHQNCFRGE